MLALICAVVEFTASPATAPPTVMGVAVPVPMSVTVPEDTMAPVRSAVAALKLTEPVPSKVAPVVSRLPVRDVSVLVPVTKAPCASRRSPLLSTSRLPSRAVAAPSG